MQHKIQAADLGPEGPAMLAAVEACVHCGFCLPACPTYTALGEEMDSPRGRIFLMKETLEGGVELPEAAPYIDRCLGCLACEPACPSGVEYGALLTPFRALSNEQGRLSPWRRLLRFLVLKTLPYPARLRPALWMAGWLRWTRGVLPQGLRAMLELPPGRSPRGRVRGHPIRSPIRGARRRNAILFLSLSRWPSAVMLPATPE